MSQQQQQRRQERAQEDSRRESASQQPTADEVAAQAVGRAEKPKSGDMALEGARVTVGKDGASNLRIQPIGTKGKLTVRDLTTGETFEQPWIWRTGVRGWSGFWVLLRRWFT